MAKPQTHDNSIKDAEPKNYESVSIQQLRGVLLKPIADAVSHYRGWVIENLSIDPSASLKPWRNFSRGFGVSDQNGYKAKVIIPKLVWSRAKTRGYKIRNDTAIDVAIAHISMGALPVSPRKFMKLIENSTKNHNKSL